MGGTVLPEDDFEVSKRREPVGVFQSFLAASILWMVNILIIVFGWPFLLYGRLKYPKSDDTS